MEYLVGEYVCSCSNIQKDDRLFYFVLGNIIREYYPDCYDYILREKLIPFCLNSSLNNVDDLYPVVIG